MRVGTLDVGSPWLDRDKNFQECFGVFFQSRLGKAEKDSLKMLRRKGEHGVKPRILFSTF
jgi:hypothetical protein